MLNDPGTTQRLDYKEKWIYLPLFLLLGIILRIPNLNESLWFDEVLYSTHVGAATLQALKTIILLDIPAPLYRVFIFFWIRLVGENSEVLIRLPSIVCGLLSILTACLLADHFFGRRTAILTGVLLCISPVHIWYSQEATPYAITQIIFLLAIYSFVLWRDNPQNKYLAIGYAISLFCAVFSHFMIMAYLIPLTLLSLPYPKLRKKSILIHLIIIVSLGIFLAIKYHFGILKTGSSFLRPFTLFQWWMLFFHWFLHGNSIWTINPYGMKPSFLIQHPSLLFVQILSFAALIRGVVLYIKQGDTIGKWELVFYLVTLPIALLCLTLIGYKNLFVERYLYAILPVFFIVLAGSATVRLNKKLASIFSTSLVLLGIIALFSSIQKNEIWTVYKPNPDWRSAAEFLVNEPRSDEKTVVYYVSPIIGLDFYINRMGAAHLFEFKQFNYDDLARYLPLSDKTVIYLVKNRYWTLDIDGVFEQLSQEKQLEQISMVSYKGIDIYIFKSP